MFMLIYFPHFVKYAFADFHKLIEQDLYDDNCKRLLICMFRESGKTSFVSIIYTIWCIAYEKRNFIIVGSDEEGAAVAILSNVIQELQGNSLLKNDFGQLYFEKISRYSKAKKKTEKNFVTTNGIRVWARGVGQKVRGHLHNAKRPDLFLGDDLQGIRNIDSRDQRDKTDNWLKSEVLSGMDQVIGKAIILGNMLHADSLVARLRKMKKVWKTHWLAIEENGVLAWPARHTFTDEEAAAYNRNRPKSQWKVSLDSIRRDKGTHIYNQEYKLKPMSNTDTIIFEDWIKWYNQEYDWFDERRFKIVMAIDPAVKEKKENDDTAIGVMAKDKVTGYVYMLDYLKAKLSYKKIKEEAARMDRVWRPAIVYVEDVAAQNWLIQDLKNDYSMPIRGLPRRTSKRVRLISVSNHFENEEVYFKRRHAEVVSQVTGFGTEPHDDLVDVVIDCVDGLLGKGKTRMRKSKAAL
jgi:predicted phage terminase large subunit-like protein